MDTSTRSIRSALWGEIEAEAVRRGLNVNSLVNLLMADYLNGDVFVLVPRKRASIPERFPDPTVAARSEPAQPAAAAALESAREAVAAAEGPAPVRKPKARPRPGRF